MGLEQLLPQGRHTSPCHVSSLPRPLLTGRSPGASKPRQDRRPTPYPGSSWTPASNGSEARCPVFASWGESPDRARARVRPTLCRSAATRGVACVTISVVLVAYAACRASKKATVPSTLTCRTFLRSTSSIPGRPRRLSAAGLRSLRRSYLRSPRSAVPRRDQRWSSSHRGSCAVPCLPPSGRRDMPRPAGFGPIGGDGYGRRDEKSSGEQAQRGLEDGANTSVPVMLPGGQRELPTRLPGAPDPQDRPRTRPGRVIRNVTAERPNGAPLNTVRGSTPRRDGSRGDPDVRGVRPGRGGWWPGRRGREVGGCSQGGYRMILTCRYCN